MKRLIITENQLENIIQKLLDNLQKEYEGKICKFKLDGKDWFDDKKYMIKTYVSEKWREESGLDYNDFWTEVLIINGRLKNSLNAFFTNKQFTIIPHLKNCEEL